jgi:hypothetical protein
MNIPATATMLDGRRVHGRLTTEHVYRVEGHAVFVDDTGIGQSWSDIARIDTHAASSRGGRAGTEGQDAARRENGRQPVHDGRRPRGRPRKTPA